MRRLVVATTVPVTAWTLMRGQLWYLREHGFDVVLVSSPGELLDATGRREGVRTRAVPMAREVRPLTDLHALGLLIRTFRAERPDVSLVSTPKAGLLAGLVAFVTRVPLRIYLLRGLRLETARPAQRRVLWLMEWISLHVAHDVIAVSPSLLRRARELRLIGRGRGVVLGRGASNGVDLERFATTAARQAAGLALRRRLGIPDDAFVFGFVGRMSLDKGLAELADAFARVTAACSTAWLMIVGEEDGAAVSTRLLSLDRVRSTGWLTEPDTAYHAMDALVLPTHREGFPNACLEAAAAGKPVITTTATGAVDSVVDGVSGILVPPRNADALCAALCRLATDRHCAVSMGRAGIDFVSRHYSNDIVWRDLTEFIEGRS